MRPLTVDGWETVSDSVKPRKPVDGSCDARTRSSGPRPKAVA